ncbi:MAG: hypothetical protein WCI65_12290 [Synechococcaceae cyanobacterium ELA263]
MKPSDQLIAEEAQHFEIVRALKPTHRAGGSHRTIHPRHHRLPPHGGSHRSEIRARSTHSCAIETLAPAAAFIHTGAACEQLLKP